jgi:hypothetical protein
MKKIAAVFAPLLAFVPAQLAGAAPTTDVLSFHAGPSREGNFVIPELTWARARAVHPDGAFKTEIAGDIDAQPLFWRAANGAGRLLVATETNGVYALDAKTGKTLWKKVLGMAVPRADLPCGNIDPMGITGTPVIDAAKDAVYLDAMVKGPDGAPRHAVFALSLKNGAMLPGWPVDIATALRAKGIDFNASVHGERGAATILGDTVYVPFGGHFGDCGAYRGAVVGVNPSASPFGRLTPSAARCGRPAVSAMTERPYSWRREIRWIIRKGANTPLPRYGARARP